MTKTIHKPVATDYEVQSYIDRVLEEAPPLTVDKRDFLTRIFANS